MSIGMLIFINFLLWKEQDSTMEANFANCSFSPHGILLESAFSKPCYYEKREAT